MPPSFPALATDIPALLFRLDRQSQPYGALGAARSLGRAGVEVRAFTDPAGEPLSRSSYLHSAYPLPRGGHTGRRAAGAADPGAGPADAVVAAALGRVAERIGRPSVLIPMDDRAALTASRLARQLRASGRYLLPQLADPALPRRLSDRAELASLCDQLGLAQPRTAIPRDAVDAVEAARDLGLPVVAKWSRPWLLPAGSGLSGTMVLRTLDAVRRLYAQTSRAGSRLLLQRLLPGSARADWWVQGCFAPDGRPLTGGTGAKALGWPRGGGRARAVSWQPHAQLARDAARLAERLGYHGILTLGFRWDAGTGAYHLLSASARPTGHFRLYTDRRGVDVVRALHLHLTGRQVPGPEPVPGRIFVTEHYGLAAVLVRAPRYRPLGARTAPGGVEVATAWFTADDPLPALVAVARPLIDGVRRLRGRGPGHPDWAPVVPRRRAVSAAEPRPAPHPAG